MSKTQSWLGKIFSSERKVVAQGRLEGVSYVYAAYHCVTMVLFYDDVNGFSGFEIPGLRSVPFKKGTKIRIMDGVNSYGYAYKIEKAE